MYCYPQYAPSYPSILNASCCPPPYPPCPPSSNCYEGVSKLANFAHYGGRYGGGNNSSKSCCDSMSKSCSPSSYQQQQQCEPKPKFQVVRRCPPLPACSPTCCVPDCKDMPAQRLRNVDVLEELCYYVPGSDPCAMDCYTVDCCGNVEKISDGNCYDPCCNPDTNSLNPVKYSRRQRFTFNDNSSASSNDPWPFPKGDCCAEFNDAKKDKCGSKGGSPYPSHGGNGGRKYTYCPNANSVDVCDMLPQDSGVYYFDRERRVFVPECALPKPPEVIERKVPVPDVEEYEILEEIKPNECEPEKPTIQPVVQPIIMPSSNPGAPPCNPCAPPPCNPCYPPPCAPPCPCPAPSCSPCPPPCNPCAPQCNPCPPRSNCCNPCGNSCNPCCNPCPPCNPCMPCGPMNPFMNMCGGVLPMVIPMCPQQPASGVMPPPPPFPFPPPFMKPKKKKKTKRSSDGSGSGYYQQGTRRESEGTDNIIVTGAPEDMLRQMGEGVPGNAYKVSMGDEVELDDEELPAFDDGTVGRQSYGNPGGGARGSYDRGRGGNGQRGPGGEGGPGSYGQGGPGYAQGGPGYGGGPGSGGYGGGARTVRKLDDGTIVTTIDFPPGEAENVAVTATQRKNENEPNIDVVAEIDGGKSGPSPTGQRVAPMNQYTENGATVTSYKMPPGKDGYVRATSAGRE